MPRSLYSELTLAFKRALEPENSEKCKGGTGKASRDAPPVVDLSEVSMSYLLPGCQRDITMILWSGGRQEGGSDAGWCLGFFFWFLLTHSGLLQGQIR